MTPNLDILSNDALIDLGAQLESELAQARSQLDAELSRLVPGQKLLVKPAVKLAMNAALAIAGVNPRVVDAQPVARADRHRLWRDDLGRA